MTKIRTSFRAFHFFGDIIPATAFEYPITRKSDIDEVCRLLSEELGIRNKKLAFNGEGSVTE